MTMNCSSLSKAQDLCSQSFVCQDFRNKNGIREGLLLAIANSTMDEVTKIIDREDEISQKIKEEVISQAVRCGRNYLLAMFNKKGQWITQQDRGDAVAAASEGNIEVLQMLIEEGQEISLEASNQARDLAVSSGDIHSVWLLTQNEFMLFCLCYSLCACFYKIFN